MNANLLVQASKIVPETGTLVNMIRLRVRQLNAGHRPLILATPGMTIADIALSEVAAEKIISEPAPIEPPGSATPLIAFPGASGTRKAA